MVSIEPHFFHLHLYRSVLLGLRDLPIWSKSVVSESIFPFTDHLIFLHLKFSNFKTIPSITIHILTPLQLEVSQLLQYAFSSLSKGTRKWAQVTTCFVFRPCTVNVEDNCSAPLCLPPEEQTLHCCIGQWVAPRWMTAFQPLEKSGCANCPGCLGTKTRKEKNNWVWTKSGDRLMKWGRI